MKVREIVLQNFRAFRGERRISFVDPVTDTVRPVTVLAGANGCGKTTLLEIIEALFKFWVDPGDPQPLIKELEASSVIAMTLELAPQDFPALSAQELQVWEEVLTGYTDKEITKRLKLRSPLSFSQVTNIAAKIKSIRAGAVNLQREQPVTIHLTLDSEHHYRRGVLAAQSPNAASPLAELSEQEQRVFDFLATGSTNKQIATQLFLAEGTVRNYVSSIFAKLGLRNRSEAAAAALRYQYGIEVDPQGAASLPLYGGLLYFPYTRRLAVTHGGAIEPPIEETPWIFRFMPSDQWVGSLEHLWVWQNYLDLEAYKTTGADSRTHLASYVESVERILGTDRRITIARGRVRVPVHWQENGERPQVRLDQLPSGEQQVLLLFGELARRRREGAVIMIDEVENSLHPTLQRLVMWNLEHLAHKWESQVIVTTHSWEVINWVRGGAFINLDYPEGRFDAPVAENGEEA